MGGATSPCGGAPGVKTIRSFAWASHSTAISEGRSRPGGCAGRMRPFGSRIDPGASGAPGFPEGVNGPVPVTTAGWHTEMTSTARRRSVDRGLLPNWRPTSAAAASDCLRGPGSDRTDLEGEAEWYESPRTAPDHSAQDDCGRLANPIAGPDAGGDVVPAARLPGDGAALAGRRTRGARQGIGPLRQDGTGRAEAVARVGPGGEAQGTRGVVALGACRGEGPGGPGERVAGCVPDAP